MTRWTLFFSLALYYNGFKRCALFYPVSVSSKAVADLLSKGEIKGMKKVLKVLGTVLGVIALLLAAFLIFATTTSLKVKPTEKMEIKGDAKAKVKAGEDLMLLSWNIGYGALDEESDFFLDGGEMVTGRSKDAVLSNVSAMEALIESVDPDIFLLQEIDLNSHRSFKIDELEMFREDFGEKYESSYACNYKAGYVPIPVPIFNAMGRVEAGIATFAKYDIKDSERVQLPIPFKWPMSLMNLKRCLLVNRIEVEGGKELVLVNLHLEAYDDGEGKAKQLGQLMDLLKEEYDKGNYVIAGGDFNQTFSTTDYAKYPKMNDWVCPVIDASLYPGFQFLMDDTHPTCRSLYKTYFDSDKEHHQYYMIDGYVVSGNIEVTSLETMDLGFKNTDHNPVALSFVLK